MTGPSNGEKAEHPPMATDSSAVVKISDILQSFNLGQREKTSFQGEYLFDDIATHGPLKADWSVYPKTGGLTLEGRLDGELALECGRCLTPFPVPVALDIDERYVFKRFMDEFGREKELQSDDFYETIDETGVLDLKDLARQFLLLEIANHTLCGQPNCQFSMDAVETPDTHTPL